MTPAALAELVRHAAAEVLDARGLDTSVLPGSVTVERPRNPEHGDYATNVAMQVAKKAGVPPRDLAGWLAEALTSEPAITSVEVAGPGFLNLRLAADAQAQIVRNVLGDADAYGRGEHYRGKRINLEFVSANPTGPIHLGGTRWAAVGDALGRVLQAQGAEVVQEYYVNDAGSQIDRFVDSLIASAAGEPTPEDGYAGAYIEGIAAAVVREDPDVLSKPDPERHAIVRRIGPELMLDEIKKSLHEFGTDFDLFFLESSLHDSGAVSVAVDRLRDEGSLYFADDAWWLRSTEYGDDKDRVVVKSDGSLAYIAGDIAYLRDKIDRGFQKCVYMLGADHHGYIARLKAVAAAMGDDPDSVEVLIGQMVNLVRDGEPVRMSKRAGTVVTLEDLVEAVGVDAARYSLIRSSVDSPLDVDLDLISKHTNENPVYYVQYAHARLSSLQRNALSLGIERGSAAETDLSLLDHDREGDLIRTLGEYPNVVRSAAELREPHRVARYLEGVAGDYHRFYAACRILQPGDDQASPLTIARLHLCEATRQVIANGLELLGVSAPEQM